MGEALPFWIALPAGILLVVGGLFTLIGSLGMLRLPSFYMRMHPPTMGVTLGIGCVLICSILVWSSLLDRFVMRALLITLFIAGTSPVSAMTLMRAAILRTPPGTTAGDTVSPARPPHDEDIARK
jgi:multicomponent K+:H+ antiporter subunit G